MMEFVFGFYNSNGNDMTIEQIVSEIQGDLTKIPNYIGARSTNIQNANIPGFEFSVVGQGQLTDYLSFTTLAGYTYINPTPINPDSSSKLHP